MESYLLFIQPHIWGQAANIMFTSIRVVCQNTLTMALNQRGGKKFRMIHTRAFDAAVRENAATAIGIAGKITRELEERSKFLVARRYEEIDLQRYVAELFQPAAMRVDSPAAEFKSVASDVFMGVSRQPGANLNEGTWWSALNAVTYYTDHVAGRDRDATLQRAWFGDRARLKNKALDLAVEYVGKSAAA